VIPKVKVFISAGEASGDLHGAKLAQAIMRRCPEARVSCLGGPMLKSSGASVLVDNRDIAVVGLFEVFRHAREILSAWRKIKDHLIRERPDVVVLIDFPDFNHLLARLAKRLGIKIFYYISPQVWAWRSGRVRSIKRLADEMAVIFPFETTFYERHGMTVNYVGHPLLDLLSDAPTKEKARTDYCSSVAGQVVGLLPGSRRSEIRLLLPLLLDSASLILKENPSVSFLLPIAPTLDPALIETELKGRNLPVRVVSGDTYGVIRACDLLLTASGTVTLEAAILGAPMIIIYRVSDFTYYAGRHLIKVSHVGLPNIVADRQIVPELLQKEATPERISAKALELLREPEALEGQRKELALIQERLGKPGVADRVAELVLKTVHAHLPSTAARFSSLS
jgi:lipid-A-disaccharide synthase